MYVCKSQTGHAGGWGGKAQLHRPSQAAGLQQQQSVPSPSLPLHAQYTATTSSPGGLSGDRDDRDGRAGKQTARTDKSGKRHPTPPPNNCRTKIPLAHPRRWHSEPSPSGRIAGVVCAGGIRMTSGLFWGRTQSGAWPYPVRWVLSLLWCAPGFGFLGWWMDSQDRQTTGPKPTRPTRACNTKRNHRAENRHPCFPFPLPPRHPGSHDQNCARGYSVGSPTRGRDCAQREMTMCYEKRRAGSIVTASSLPRRKLS